MLILVKGGAGLTLYPSLLLPVAAGATMLGFWLVAVALDITRSEIALSVQGC